MPGGSPLATFCFGMLCIRWRGDLTTTPYAWHASSLPMSVSASVVMGLALVMNRQAPGWTVQLHLKYGSTHQQTIRDADAGADAGPVVA